VLNVSARGLPLPVQPADADPPLYFLRLECRAAAFKCRLRRRPAAHGAVAWGEPFRLDCPDNSILRVALMQCPPAPGDADPAPVGETDLRMCLPPGSQDVTAEAWHTLRLHPSFLAERVDVGFRMRLRGPGAAPDTPPEASPALAAPAPLLPAQTPGPPSSPGSPTPVPSPRPTEEGNGRPPYAEPPAAAPDAKPRRGDAAALDDNDQPDPERAARRALAAAARAARRGAVQAEEEEARLARQLRRQAEAFTQTASKLDRARAGAQVAAALAAGAERLLCDVDMGWQRALSPVGRPALTWDRGQPPWLRNDGGARQPGARGGRGAAGSGRSLGTGLPAAGELYDFDRRGGHWDDVRRCAAALLPRRPPAPTTAGLVRAANGIGPGAGLLFAGRDRLWAR
jgi:hypothetical protein